MMHLGVDTGGTFTDFILLRDNKITQYKTLSTPAAPEHAILNGIDALNITAAVSRGEVNIVHGSTVATNAALEGKGVKTAYICNRGLADVLIIGRQARDSLYSLEPQSKPHPLDPDLCIELDCRLDAQGKSVTTLEDDAIAELIKKLEGIQALKAVAINLLFSYLNPTDEIRIQSAIENHFGAQLFVSRSSYVLPEYKEYERGMACFLNACLGPLVGKYLNQLERKTQPSPLTIMQSTGGTMAASVAAKRAVNMLLSGPAGGLAAATAIGAQLNIKQIMTFDMGGTSTDVALIDGDIRLSNEGSIGAFPVSVPMVDMHTIGAGGGSLAQIDDAGVLLVGPQSAGATPGPACYGQGGTTATVTDANAFLGLIRPEAPLGGSLSIDTGAADNVICALAQSLHSEPVSVALAIRDIANEHMCRALRHISISKGHDPKAFVLMCFGGAGGLHLCDIADNLGIPTAIIPNNGGVLSAYGMLVAHRERQLSQSIPGQFTNASMALITQGITHLEQQGRKELIAEGVNNKDIQIQASLDLRYTGQTFTLNVELGTFEQCCHSFHQRHQQRYGHAIQAAIEIVNVRLRLWVPNQLRIEPQADISDSSTITMLQLPFSKTEVLAIERSAITLNQWFKGPALITEAISTSYIKSGWQYRRDSFGHLHLRARP